jgi:hypothetical protein
MRLMIINNKTEEIEEYKDEETFFKLLENEIHVFAVMHTVDAVAKYMTECIQQLLKDKHIQINE